VDLPAIADLAAQALPEAWSQAALEASLEMEAHQMVVIEDAAKERAGYYLVCRIDLDSELLQLVVAPSYRRQGFGSQLLQHLITNTPTGGQITLEVRASNYAAIALYQRHHFVRIATRSNYYRPSQANRSREDAVIMRYPF